MKKSKAIFVTALLAVALAAVWACLWRISTLGFAIMTAIFSVFGFSFSAVAFCDWLAKAPETPVDKLELPELSEETLEPPIITGEITATNIRSASVNPISAAGCATPELEHQVNIDELTYDEIRKEVKGL